MGVLARVLESAGLSTTSLSLVREHTARVKPPRALFVPYPFGRPLGYPDDPARQTEIVRAALALFAEERGPVLRDHPDPAYDRRPDLGVPQAAAIPWTERPLSVADELTALRPEYEHFVATQGRTGVGLSGIPERRFRGVVRFLEAYATGEAADHPDRPADVAVPRFIRLCADDLKAFYLEARLGRGDRPDFQDVARWLWGETALAGLLRAVRDRMKASGDPALDDVAFGIAR